MGVWESSSVSFLTRGKSLKNDPWVHDKSLQLCPTLCDPMNSSLPVLCPRDSPGKNFGVGCHSLLQGLFLTQGSNSCLLHWQAGFFFFNHECHLESPKDDPGLHKKTSLEEGSCKTCRHSSVATDGPWLCGGSCFLIT